MSGKQVIEILGLTTIGPYPQAVSATGLFFVFGQPAS
jgi:hypothetical protein